MRSPLYFVDSRKPAIALVRKMRVRKNMSARVMHPERMKAEETVYASDIQPTKVFPIGEEPV